MQDNKHVNCLQPVQSTGHLRTGVTYCLTRVSVIRHGGRLNHSRCSIRRLWKNDREEWNFKGSLDSGLLDRLNAAVLEIADDVTKTQSDVGRISLHVSVTFYMTPEWEPADESFIRALAFLAKVNVSIPPSIGFVAPTSNSMPLDVLAFAWCRLWLAANKRMFAYTVEQLQSRDTAIPTIEYPIGIVSDRPANNTYPPREQYTFGILTVDDFKQEASPMYLADFRQSDGKMPGLPALGPIHFVMSVNAGIDADDMSDLQTALRTKIGAEDSTTDAAIVVVRLRDDWTMAKAYARAVVPDWAEYTIIRLFNNGHQEYIE